MLLLSFHSDILCAIHNYYFIIVSQYKHHNCTYNSDIIITNQFNKFHTHKHIPTVDHSQYTNYRMASAQQRALTIYPVAAAAAPLAVSQLLLLLTSNYPPLQLYQELLKSDNLLSSYDG